jgi:aminomethyltransferase
VTLDGHIPALLVGMPVDIAGGVPAYVLLVPKTAARVMWRSLLSFTWVEPVGRTAVLGTWSQLPWAQRLDSTDVVEIAEQDLRAWGLLRRGNDFVGARGILEG